MARFAPFPGVLYATGDGAIDAVVAPPYDVIGEVERTALEAKSAHNAVRIELPRDEGARSRYQVAADLFTRWKSEGVLVGDTDEAFYVYRMDFRDESGAARATSGVIGALELQEPGTGEIFPHERTTPKDKADRLDILRATMVNLSPIWALSTAAGLASACEQSGPPDLHATDAEGVRHSLWRVARGADVDVISAAVSSAPVIIADGHHRFEVANAYRAEQRAANGDGAAGYDAIMAFVVELSEDQLCVEAIHRLLVSVPQGQPLVQHLDPWFEPTATGPADASLSARMDAAGALGLVTRDGTWLLRPRPETMAHAEHDLDSSRLDVALGGLGGVDVKYQHGVDQVVDAVTKGDADAAILLRPATVAQIAAIAHGGERMPPKTTFFYPKLRTGMVFREVGG